MSFFYTSIFTFARAKDLNSSSVTTQLCLGLHCSVGRLVSRSGQTPRSYCENSLSRSRTLVECYATFDVHTLLGSSGWGTEFKKKKKVLKNWLYKRKVIVVQFKSRQSSRPTSPFCLLLSVSHRLSSLCWMFHVPWRHVLWFILKAEMSFSSTAPSERRRFQTLLFAVPLFLL